MGTLINSQLVLEYCNDAALLAGDTPPIVETADTAMNSI